eukprot:6081815-Alexandrium_andersonii.AAC.1
MRDDAARLPPIPWTLDPDSHAAELAQQLRSLIATHCPAKPAPRKEWILPDTWQLHERVKALRQAVKAYK